MKTRVKTRTVLVNGTQCLVQSLREWLKDRIDQIESSRQSAFMEGDVARMNEISGRYWELKIIQDKVNDGRIREIGRE